VTKGGYAKLADFGLAKLDSPRDADAVTRAVTEGRTRPGVIVGTIAYMSPEQAGAQPVDARSDIFSFGVVLYEQLAGQRPFKGQTDLEVLQAVSHRAPASLSNELPVALRMIVDKSLEKDPADRYQTMRDMVVDLRKLTRQIVADMGVVTRRARVDERWMAAGVALAGLIGAVIWLGGGQRSQASGVRGEPRRIACSVAAATASAQ
jgi:serine/threonine protein kinase